MLTKLRGIMNAEAVLNQVLSHVLTCVGAAVQILSASKAMFVLLKLIWNGGDPEWKWEEHTRNYRSSL